jgi:hypothetical protein
MKPSLRAAALCLAIAAGVSAQNIHSNGPLVTHPGGGFGGNDASALDTTAQPAGPGFNILGYNTNVAAGVRVTDDFTVPCGQIWNINSIKAFGYQTGSGTAAPTLNGGNYKIWNAQPGTAGAVLLFDYSASNQMTSVGFMSPFNYRTTITTLATGNTRPIQTVTMAGNGISLIPGTYWLDWGVSGTSASGPFCPPVSIIGTYITGNSLQSTGAGWTALTDGLGGTIYAQGMPFEIDHGTTFFPCFALNITQASPGANVVLTDSGGIPGFQAFNAITLNPGAYPNDWFFGVGISLYELSNLLTSGPPFLVTFPGSGTFTLSIPYGLPGPITVYYVGLMLNGNQLATVDVAKTVTLQ